MSTIVFDSHAFIKKLIAVGFTEQQAEVLMQEQANLIEDGLATKQDIRELKRELKQDIAELRRDMKELETRIIIKLGAMMIAMSGTLFALLKTH